MVFGTGSPAWTLLELRPAPAEGGWWEPGGLSWRVTMTHFSALSCPPAALPPSLIASLTFLMRLEDSLTVTSHSTFFTLHHCIVLWGGQHLFPWGKSFLPCCAISGWLASHSQAGWRPFCCVNKMVEQLLRSSPHVSIPWYSLCSGLCFHFPPCTCGHTCSLHLLGMFYGRKMSEPFSDHSLLFFPLLDSHNTTLLMISSPSASIFSPHMKVDHIFMLTSLFSAYFFILISWHIFLLLFPRSTEYFLGLVDNRRRRKQFIYLPNLSVLAHPLSF